MSNVQRVIIVGGGSFGMSAAIELHRRGYQVDVFDLGPIPYLLAATTDISKVLRMDYGADEDYMILMEQAFEVWDRWNRALPEPLWHETGFVIMKHEEMKPGSLNTRVISFEKNAGTRWIGSTGRNSNAASPPGTLKATRMVITTRARAG